MLNSNLQVLKSLITIIVTYYIHEKSYFEKGINYFIMA